MPAIEQSGFESWRLIVLDQQRREILVVPDKNPPALCLPTVDIPSGQRIAEGLNRAVKSTWNCNAICLFTPTVTSPSQLRYAVIESLQYPETCSNYHSVRLHDLAASSFLDQGDFLALQQCLAELRSHEIDAGAPLTRQRWFVDLQSWIADLLRPFELKLTGEFDQLNASPSFSLFRFETTGSDVWFKAVGEPNLREFPITLELARRFPGYLPKIIGHRSDWNGWLAFSAGLKNLSDTGDLASWESTVNSFANLQIDSIESSEALLEAGAHDLRTQNLSLLVQPFLDVVSRLMREQTKASPKPLSEDDLGLLGLRLQDAITLLEDLRVPNALGHLDLNPENVVLAGEKYKFLDWAEAYIGLPFFSFEYLLAHLRRTAGFVPEQESSLLATYSRPWIEILSQEVVTEAFSFVPLVAVFAYAAGLRAWLDEEALADPKVAGCIRSLARRMNREAVQLIDRRVPCLN